MLYEPKWQSFACIIYMECESYRSSYISSQFSFDFSTEQWTTEVLQENKSTGDHLMSLSDHSKLPAHKFVCWTILQLDKWHQDTLHLEVSIACIMLLFILVLVAVTCRHEKSICITLVAVHKRDNHRELCRHGHVAHDVLFATTSRRQVQCSDTALPHIISRKCILSRSQSSQAQS